MARIPCCLSWSCRLSRSRISWRATLGIGSRAGVVGLARSSSDDDGRPAAVDRAAVKVGTSMTDPTLVDRVLGATGGPGRHRSWFVAANSRISSSFILSHAALLHVLMMITTMRNSDKKSNKNTRNVSRKTTKQENNNNNKISLRHSKPRSASHCRVLPPGEFNAMILGPLSVYSENIMVIDETITSPLNTLDCRGNYSATSNDIKLVHWPLMGGLLHLVQRGGDWVGWMGGATARSGCYIW